MVQVWWSYCPLGGCTKGNSTLGRSYSEQRAQQRIFDHVFGSPAHQVGREDAQTLADGANEADSTLITEMIEEEPWDGSTEHQNKKQRTNWRDQQQCQVVASRSGQSVPGDLGDQIRQQTRNAFVFVKARATNISDSHSSLFVALTSISFYFLHEVCFCRLCRRRRLPLRQLHASADRQLESSRTHHVALLMKKLFMSL